MGRPTVTPPEPIDRESLLNPFPRLRLRALLFGALLTVFYLWGLAGVEVRISALAEGIPNIFDFLRRLMPPTWKTVETPLIIPALALPFGITIPAVGFPSVTI